ncbi:gag-pol polyprotein [Hordeum vulgare]|nr:gag-pol polyprotein [Hordeum vulgare]
MSKPDKLHDDAPRSDMVAIPLCGIDYTESTMTLFEDDAAMTMITEPLMEHALEACDKVASKDDASIYGGESAEAVLAEPQSASSGDDATLSGARHSLWSACRDFGTMRRILNDYESLHRGASTGVCAGASVKHPGTPSIAACRPRVTHRPDGAAHGDSASLPRARV